MLYATSFIANRFFEINWWVRRIGLQRKNSKLSTETFQTVVTCQRQNKTASMTITLLFFKVLCNQTREQWRIVPVIQVCAYYDIKWRSFAALPGRRLTWNGLPSQNVTSAPSLTVFRKRLKAQLCSRSFSTDVVHRPFDFSLTYLLTYLLMY